VTNIISPRVLCSPIFLLHLVQKEIASFDTAIPKTLSEQNMKWIGWSKSNCRLWPYEYRKHESLRQVLWSCHKINVGITIS